MGRERRSGERLFYWSKLRDGVGVLRLRSRVGFAAAAASLRMTGVRLRMTGLAMIVLVSLGLVCAQAWATGPALTTITDIVYRADGQTASGTVLISWPAFRTTEGDVVAAGNQSVEIGEGGSFTTQLVPNVGSTPAGTLYTVVYQLQSSFEVRTEYWSVPATATTTISAIRTTPGVGVANPAATQQYVDQAVSNLATKAYVDSAVSNVGAGAFVAKTGDTMSGPLTLPADPVAPYQASTRHYVDNGLAAKADLIAGVVPAGQLGSGVASASTCLNGNSTWGACGGAPAGVTYASTSLNWSQTISSALAGGTAATVTLTPCPVGVDTTSGAGYEVLVSGGGNSEAVKVVSGSCVSGAASGTITFTPYFSYPAGSTVGSASSGIQETINSACGVDPTYYKNGQCNVVVPANGPGYPAHALNTYSVAGTIYLHTNQSVLGGYGTSLDCTGRGPCLQIGDLTNSNHFGNNTVQGFSFRTPVDRSTNSAYAGVAITQTQRTSQVATITTATAHGFRPGDMVVILFTDDSRYWGDAIVQSVPSATTFTYAHQGADITAQTTPGVVALGYEAVLDNGMNTHLTDISYDLVGENGHFNNFFDFWDDENALIEHFNNNAISLNGNANWTGSFVFSGGNPPNAGQQVAPVITLRDSTITANYSNGITVYNSNGVYVENTVVQASGPWQVYSANTTGNYQGAYLKNIYSESSVAANPATPAHSPFPGTGIAGLIAGSTTGAGQFTISGSGGVLGGFPSGGSGSMLYSYFIMARDVTTGTMTSLMQVMNYKSTGSDSITVNWPRVANQGDTITYDVIRTTTPGNGFPYPSAGNCNGGSATACGSVAVNVAQCSGLVCSYADNGSVVTQAYTIPSNSGNYGGNLAFWPGSIVSVNKTVAVDVEHSNVVGVGLSNGPIQAANRCLGYGQASAGGYTACLSSVTTPNNSVPNQTATLMTDGSSTGGGQTLSKGRLNFNTSPFAALQPHHIITLVDSQAALTRATLGYRPPAGANDVWIGTDVAPSGVNLSSGRLAFGAPVSITHYIGSTGDGVTQNWLERLSSALKEFNVPVKFDQSVNATGGLVLPQGSGYAPASGGIGLDTAAGLPVVNVGGSTHQVAFTSSNISGQAGTALALAATPTQCSGAFATGIQASGNANCTTPNVIQLAETTQPAGIPNWGVFWFDSATHSPRVIENNGQVVQLGLTNLFNSDPGGDPTNNVEQKNGTNPQGLRIYKSYDSSNPSNYERMAFGYDGTRYFVGDQALGTGSSRGIGFKINNTTEWFISANGALKPGTANTVDIGGNGNEVQDYYFRGGLLYGLANEGSTGTIQYAPAKYVVSGSNAVAVRALPNDTGIIGITKSASATSGNAEIVQLGYVLCTFENATVAGDYVGNATGATPGCRDLGATKPTGMEILGRAMQTGAAGNSYMFVSPTAQFGSGGGAVSSVFGRTGAVTASAGDYSVAQITGAAADAAVVHLSGAETISGAKTFSNDVTLNGNLNVAGTISQTSSGPTQWSGKKWTGTSATVPSGSDFSLGVGSDSAFKCQLAGGGSCLPANTSQFAWTCPVSGSTAVAQHCNWTLPAGLTITGFDFAANTAPVGCSTYPTFQVWDGTTGAQVGSYSVTLSSGNNFYSQVTGSVNIPAGHLLRVKVTTAASGCTTNAGGLVGTVTYQMQN